MVLSDRSITCKKSEVTGTTILVRLVQGAYEGEGIKWCNGLANQELLGQKWSAPTILHSAPALGSQFLCSFYGCNYMGVGREGAGKLKCHSRHSYCTCPMHNSIQ